MNTSLRKLVPCLIVSFGLLGACSNSVKTEEQALEAAFEDYVEAIREMDGKKIWDLSTNACQEKKTVKEMQSDLTLAALLVGVETEYTEIKASVEEDQGTVSFNYSNPTDDKPLSVLASGPGEAESHFVLEDGTWRYNDRTNC